MSNNSNLPQRQFDPPNKPLPAIPKKSLLHKMKVNSSKFLDKIPQTNPNLGQKTIISDLQKNKAGQILPELPPRPKKKKDSGIMQFFGGKKSLKKRTKRKRAYGRKSSKRRTKKRKAKRTKKRRSLKRRKRKTRRR